MGSREDAEQYIADMFAKRGFTLDLHRYMAVADLEWSKKYGEFLDETYYKQRTLDRKTNELLQTVVDAWYAGAAAASGTRLVTRNAISLAFFLPSSYANRIRGVEGVHAVAWSNWFGGIYQIGRAHV